MIDFTRFKGSTVCLCAPDRTLPQVTTQASTGITAATRETIASRAATIAVTDSNRRPPPSTPAITPNAESVLN